MKTYEEVMQLTRTISGEAALEEPDARGLYNALLEVPTDGLVVEVGCQLGRSSSLILQLAQDQGFHSVHVDNHKQQPDYLRQWIQMAWEIGGDDDHRFTLLCMRTEQGRLLLDKLCRDGIDLAFIDGDHNYPGVMMDLEVLAPQVKVGGLLTLHDYGRNSLPAVWRAANDYIDESGDGQWDQVGVFGTLGVWRRR